MQGRLIGLCGNMDGETVSELRDPSHCILTSGQIMAASYLLSNSPSKCSGMPDEIRNQLRREQADCVVDERHPSRLSEGPTNSGFRPPSSCRIQRTLVVLRGEEKKLEKCFSTQIVTECKLPCQLSDSVARNVMATFCSFLIATTNAILAVELVAPVLATVCIYALLLSFYRLDSIACLKVNWLMRWNKRLSCAHYTLSSGRRRISGQRSSFPTVAVPQHELESAGHMLISE